MANLKAIRNRIASVKGTQKITRAMKMVAAAKLRRAQDNIFNLRPYAQNVIEVLSDVAAMTTSEARGTPAMPFDVTISSSSMVICWLTVISMP